MNIARVASLALLLLLPACAPGSGVTAAAASEREAKTHPVSGLPLMAVNVDTANGPHLFVSEYASTPEQRERGLMFRTELGADEGMLFDFTTTEAVPVRRSFWMRNTYIPLDIIFIGADGTIDTIAANTVPYSLTAIPSKGPAPYVLEIPGGRAAELGIREGGKVRFKRP